MSATSIRNAIAHFNFGQLVGESPTLQAALGRAEQVARTTATVLLRGRAAPERAGRTPSTSTRHASPGRLCASTARRWRAGVLESELFGHERGAPSLARSPAILAASSWPMAARFSRRDRRSADGNPGQAAARAAERSSTRRRQRDAERSMSASSRPPTATRKPWCRGPLSRGSVLPPQRLPILLPLLRDRIEDVPLLCRIFAEVAAVQRRARCRSSQRRRIC